MGTHCSTDACRDSCESTELVETGTFDSTREHCISHMHRHPYSSAPRKHPTHAGIEEVDDCTTLTSIPTNLCRENSGLNGLAPVKIIDDNSTGMGRASPWGDDSDIGHGPLLEVPPSPVFCPPPPSWSPLASAAEFDGEGQDADDQSFHLPRQTSYDAILASISDAQEGQASRKKSDADTDGMVEGTSSDRRSQEGGDGENSTREPSADDEASNARRNAATEAADTASTLKALESDRGEGDAADEEPAPSFHSDQVADCNMRIDAVENSDGDEDQASKSGTTYFDRERGELNGVERADMDLQEDRPLHTFRSGATYLGQWRGNMRHGFGVQRWPDGASYEGEWQNDGSHGQGHFKYCEGTASYTGQWRCNHANGVGTAVHEDRTYHGEWIDDFQSGVGVEVWHDGSKFQGEFKHGTKHGVGFYQWSDGSSHSGTWKDGMMHGAGEFRGVDGRVFHGTWVEHKKNGIGKCTWESGEKYAGQYVNDVKEGFGDFWWPDGTLKRCFWRGGMPTDVFD